MRVDIKYETAVLEPDIKAAEDYLSCERVLVNNIRQHLVNGMGDDELRDYAAALAEYYTARIKAVQTTTVCVNYRYAVAFLNVLHETPFLINWIRSSKL